MVLLSPQTHERSQSVLLRVGDRLSEVSGQQRRQKERRAGQSQRCRPEPASRWSEPFYNWDGGTTLRRTPPRYPQGPRSNPTVDGNNVSPEATVVQVPPWTPHSTKAERVNQICVEKMIRDCRSVASMLVPRSAGHVEGLQVAWDQWFLPRFLRGCVFLRCCRYRFRQIARAGGER